MFLLKIKKNQLYPLFDIDNTPLLPTTDKPNYRKQEFRKIGLF